MLMMIFGAGEAAHKEEEKGGEDLSRVKGGVIGRFVVTREVRLSTQHGHSSSQTQTK